MAGYLFYPTADKAQDAIWDYTFTTWGETQAIKFIQELHIHLRMLADKEKFWFPLPQKLIVPSDLAYEAYFSRYKNYYIFFRKLEEDQIGVMSILHERSDIPKSLFQDLRAIEHL